MDKALIEYKGKRAGLLKEADEGYEFTYDKDYLADATSFPVSLTLPLSEKPYKSKSNNLSISVIDCFCSYSVFCIEQKISKSVFCKKHRVADLILLKYGQSTSVVRSIR